ncbi:MAG: hypothetical protein B7Z37_24060 [Verrucomicrobia bacterium 12-59-8]|nr:MAG: hypothetical protein B7Z37_24060 [Verrucomicrobia bacterium 12-59-8]
MSDHAIANAKSWIADIVALAARLKSPDYSVADEARDEAWQMPLSVEVRDGWRAPSAPGEPIDADPEEFAILLTTGGPALRIYGHFGPGMRLEDIELQWQDWGTPWTYVVTTEEEDAAIRTFCECHNLGND